MPPRKTNKDPESKVTKISAATQRSPYTGVQVVTQISLEHSSKKGLGFIFSHLHEPIWPRTISTKTTQGRQVIVNCIEEALAQFKAANYVDCRISAYPYWRPSPVCKFVGIKNAIPPDLIMIDLDRCNFGFDDKALKSTLRQTLQKIKQRLSLRPTVIWSGNGFHIYIPINVIALEDIKQFACIEHVSTKFLRFAEWYLSCGKSDSVHNSIVSLNNCMLRIPGSVNLKNSAQVRVIKKWDGSRPNINLLLGTFCSYLMDKRIKGQKAIVKIVPSGNSAGTIQWIEQLLCTPIADHRKFALWRILAPYLINVKGLSTEQVFSIIEQWLDRCNQLNRLSFSSTSKIRESIKGAVKGYCPISYEKLKSENNGLYEIVNRKQGLIS